MMRNLKKVLVEIGRIDEATFAAFGLKLIQTRIFDFL